MSFRGGFGGRGGSRGGFGDRGGSRGGFGDRGGRGGGGRGSFRGGRGGGTGGFSSFQSGPPSEVEAAGIFLHACENELVFQSVTGSQVPKFNQPVYFENIQPMGQLDEIFGAINDVYFSVKTRDGIVASSFSKGDKCYIGPQSTLPLEWFIEQEKPKVKGASRGRGGASRGGSRGGFGASRGGFSRGGFGDRGRGFSRGGFPRGGFGDRGGSRGGGFGGRGGGFGDRGGSRGGFSRGMGGGVQKRGTGGGFGRGRGY